MAKDNDFQEKKAQHKNTMRHWMLGEKGLPSGRPRPNFLIAINEGKLVYYSERDQRQINIMSRDHLVAHVSLASSELAERSGEPALEMSQGQARDCMAVVEAYVLHEGNDRLIRDEIKPIAFSNDDCYCFERINVPRLEPQEYKRKTQEDLGPFLNSIRTSMADYNEDTNESLMFRRLLSAIGQLLWDSKPSREIVYWYGKGGDGKTTLCNYLASKLGSAAMPNLKPRNLESEYYLAELEGKRMVIAEEAGKGQFLTEGIKAITGNRFITGRHPHERIRTFESHVMIWYTSNEFPIIDGEDSSRDRLRLIHSQPRPNRTRRSEEDIRQELDYYWDNIVHASVSEYFAAGQGIHTMLEAEVAEAVEAYYMDADGWITNNLVYMPGAFIPTSVLRDASKNSRISIKSITARLGTLEALDKNNIDGEIKNIKRRITTSNNPVWGYNNIGFQEKHPDYYKDSWRKPMTRFAFGLKVVPEDDSLPF
jgi:hypothetical protein